MFHFRTKGFRKLTCSCLFLVIIYDCILFTIFHVAGIPDNLIVFRLHIIRRHSQNIGRSIQSIGIILSVSLPIQ